MVPMLEKESKIFNLFSTEVNHRMQVKYDSDDLPRKICIFILQEMKTIII